MSGAEEDPRRRIPQVERLVGALVDDARALGLPRPVATDAVREVVESLRERAERTGEIPDESGIIDLARAELGRRARRLLRPAINATGVVVHTNLGRAPLSRDALDAVAKVAGGYSNLEFDLAAGRRGDRFVHVEPLLALATGAPAALVVNNNAAAVLLVCAALARGREVVISRGELIEIGGSFRIPEVLEQSGAILREVGTTNRTHLADYERAISEETAMVLAVHPSNYRVVGFTASPDTAELAELAHARGVPLVYDAGSGLVGRDLADEPVVDELLGAGADLVCFSGDKLLGGPQAGIVCGDAELVGRLRRHPLLRALRPDKMTLAALEATVIALLSGDRGSIPVWRMLDTPADELRERCSRLRDELADADLDVALADGESVVGGGSLPGHGIPSTVLVIRPRSIAPERLAEGLRLHDPPIVARVTDDGMVCDLRTVDPADDGVLAAAIRAGAGKAEPPR